MAGHPSRAPKLWPLVMSGVLFLGLQAAAAPLELEFAKGVVAFSRGDLSGAESHFNKVIQQDPKNHQAIYYLGQACLGLGQVKKATGLFRRVLELNPQNHGVLLDLAQAQVKSQDFKGAEATLDQALLNLSKRASVHYYLGFCRYRQMRFKEAIEPLKKAQSLDQGFAAAAGYYLGLSHLKAGEQKAAIQQFRLTASRAGTGEVGELARESLGLLVGAQAVPGTGELSGFVSSGAGFDSNVTLDPSDASGASSGTAFLSLGGSYSPLKTGSDEVQLGGSLYRNFHLAENATGFNLTDISLSLAWRHLFESRHRLELDYGYNLDLLDGGKAAAYMLAVDDFSVYMQAHQARARFAFFEGPNLRTTAGYRFRALRFAGHLDQRDIYGHEVSITQDILLSGGRLHLVLTLGAAYEDGREKAWNLWGPFATFTARVRVRESLIVWLQADYHHEDHFDSAGVWDPERQRVDNRWAMGAGCNIELIDNLSLAVSYRYLKNVSLEGFSYQRHLASGALVYRF